MQVQSINAIFKDLLSSLETQAFEEKNNRTQSLIKVLPGGYSFKLSLGSGRLPVAGNRRYFPHIAAAETAWQLLGTKDPEFILRHAPKLWEKFVEDGELKTAYGWRWRTAFGRDQLQRAVDTLALNQSDRQVYIATWDPRADGLGEINGPKNIPCPVGFSLNIVDGALHMAVHVRSSDVFVGLPYDIMSYALTMDAIAATLGVPLGTMHFTLAHAHIYEIHWLAAQVCVYGAQNLPYQHKERYGEATTNWPKDCSPNLPGWSIDQIMANPNGYVATVKTLSTRVKPNKWNPMPEVVA